jgi:hypothetical protein
MKTINELLPGKPGQNELPGRRESGSGPSESREERAVFIGRVWAELQHKRLVHEPHGSEAFKSFARDIADLTQAQIRIGLEKCKDFTGFFTTGEFRRMCRQIDHEAMGAPDPTAAFQEACKNAHSLAGANWSHPAVYHAGADVGWYELARASYTGPEREAFKQSYFERCRQAQGGVLPPIPTVELVTHGIKRKASAEARLQYLEELYGVLGSRRNA